jgi:hypothetical protein
MASIHETIPQLAVGSASVHADLPLMAAGREGGTPPARLNATPVYLSAWQMPAGLSGQCRHGTDPGAAPAP